MALEGCEDIVAGEIARLRFAVETLPPFLMAGVRFLIAGSILYTFLRLRGAPNPSWPQWRAAGCQVPCKRRRWWIVSGWC